MFVRYRCAGHLLFEFDVTQFQFVDGTFQRLTFSSLFGLLFPLIAQLLQMCFATLSPQLNDFLIFTVFLDEFIAYIDAFIVSFQME